MLPTMMEGRPATPSANDLRNTRHSMAPESYARGGIVVHRIPLPDKIEKKNGPKQRGMKERPWSMRRAFYRGWMKFERDRAGAFHPFWSGDSL